MLMLDGRPAAKALNEKTRRLIAEYGLCVRLAIVMVGDEPSSASYANSIQKRCAAIGIEPLRVDLPSDIDEKELIAKVEQLNLDTGVNGIMLLRPLPRGINETLVCDSITPEKDVDCASFASLGLLMRNRGFAPCTAQACIELLDYYGIGVKGKRAVVVGRSLVVGKPLALLLMARDATVTVCHSKTLDLPSVTQNCDLLFAAIGKPRFISDEYVSVGQCVVDVGVNFDANGVQCGDVDFAAVNERCGAISPVPFGVGSVTTAVLLNNTTNAAIRQGETHE